MITKSIILIPILTLQLMLSANSFQSAMPFPVEVNNENKQVLEVKQTLYHLKAPISKVDKLAKGCVAANVATGIDPHLIATLMASESDFKINAQSSMGYKGLMQTPKAEMKNSRSSTDIVKGAEILKEKLDIAGGSYEKALTYYKGSDYMFKGSKESLGHQQAMDVLKKYAQIKENLKQKETKVNG
jgi:hypothetical protein